MADKLIIVESPTKCRTIGAILGKGYLIKSTLGHIRDLPKYKIGVDIEHDFTPFYEVSKDKKKVVKELVADMKKAKDVYIATDEDREGEAIGWHVVNVSGLDEKKFKRITFHEITKDAIKASLVNPRTINLHLVDAQQARRVLDRLVGYKLSPLLSKKIYKGLSAGRVQSVTVRIIIEREREIRNFVKQEYWTIKAECKKDNIKFDAFFTERAGVKYKKHDIKDEAMVKNLLKGIEPKDFIVDSIQKKDKKRNPLPPFITSTLQQTASNKYGFSAKKTMSIAQSLYEGINLGDETAGLITYMRTDSTAVAASAQKEALDFIVSSYGKDYIPEKPRVYKSKVKNAQEAHECIRATSVLRIPEKVEQYLNKDQYKLYCLIWERFVASQMKEALFEQTSVVLKKDDSLWTANGQVCIFDGYLRVYKFEDEGDGEEKGLLPALKQNELVNVLNIIPEQHFTEPPARYSEASLIKTLEGYGIGRPSTYAPTISTIIERGYVKLDKKRFIPEEIGFTVTEILEKHFPEIVDIHFTANMEENLDKIADGEKEWVNTIREFYTPFEKKLKAAETNIVSQKVLVELDRKCPKCGKPLVERNSRFGKFIGCSGYPECKYIEREEKETPEEQEILKDPCPKCGGTLAVKNSRFGKFIGCSNYPKCKYTKSLEEEKIDKACPDCGKPLVVRRGRRGKFLGCSGYPDCKHMESMPKKES
jgi:DNA topoisomerase I